MPTKYELDVIHEGDPRAEAMVDALDAELRELGLHLDIEVSPHSNPADLPSGSPLLVVFASDTPPPDWEDALLRARDSGQLILPVVNEQAEIGTHLTDQLDAFNAWFYQEHPDPARDLARFLLEQLGVEERQRRVFISHRRSDGLLVAEQLYHALIEQRFRPFIDRFDIDPAADVQARIADVLEDYAFLLLLESPGVSESEWAFYEVEYALSHTMGIHIVSWPGDPPTMPGTHGLARQKLARTDLVSTGPYDELVDTAVQAVVAEVEDAHARGLARRRKNLLRSVQDVATASGRSCTVLPHWRLLVEDAAARHVVGVTPRLPLVEDLKALHDAAGPIADPANCLLVHAARSLGPDRKALLEWARSGRSIRLVPENAVGGAW